MNVELIRIGDQIIMAVKNRLKEILKKKGITQTELAEKVGVSRQTISAIINEKTDPSLELAIDIAIYLKKSLDTLFFKIEDDSYADFKEMNIRICQLEELVRNDVIDMEKYKELRKKEERNFMQRYGYDMYQYYTRVNGRHFSIFGRFRRNKSTNTADKE